MSDLRKHDPVSRLNAIFGLMVMSPPPNYRWPLISFLASQRQAARFSVELFCSIKSCSWSSPNETQRSSFRLELSITTLEKLLDLVPNGTSQFQCFRTRLAPHGEHLCVGYNTLTMLPSHSFRVPRQREARKAMPAKLRPPRPADAATGRGTHRPGSRRWGGIPRRMEGQFNRIAGTGPEGITSAGLRSPFGPGGLF